MVERVVERAVERAVSGRLDHPDIHLRHLTAFLAVVEEGSVTAAAGVLFMAPSGVSQAIAQLERSVGVTVFVRSRLGMRPTPAGHALIGPARRALEAFGSAVAAPGGVRATAATVLDVVCTPSLAQEPTSTILGFFHRRHPEVRVRLSEPRGPFVSAAVDAVLAGSSQVAVTEAPGPVPGVRVTPMRDLEICVVCPPGSLGGPGRPGPGLDAGAVPLETILDIGLIVAPFFESSEVYRSLQPAAHRLGRSLDQAIVVRNEHRGSFMSMAHAGAGAALLHRARGERARQAGCDTARLDVLPVRRLAAVVRDQPQQPVVEAFVALCASSDVAAAWGTTHGRLP